LTRATCKQPFSIALNTKVTPETQTSKSHAKGSSTNKFTMSSITHVSFFFHFTPIIISTTSTFFSTVTRITFCFSSYLVSFPVLGRQVSTRDVGTTTRGHKRQKKHSKHFSFLSGMTKRCKVATTSAKQSKTRDKGHEHRSKHQNTGTWCHRNQSSCEARK